MSHEILGRNVAMRLLLTKVNEENQEPYFVELLCRIVPILRTSAWEAHHSRPPVIAVRSGEASAQVQ